MTIQEKYDWQQLEIRKQIRLLQQRLDAHRSQQKLQPRNQSFVADLDSILMNLTEMNKYLR